MIQLAIFTFIFATMNCYYAVIMTFVVSIGNLPCICSAQSETEGGSLEKIDVPKRPNFAVDGLVQDRKKYSFTLRGPDRNYDVKLTNRTTIHARLIRPEFNWKKRAVSVTIPMSALDGIPKNNHVVTYQLPQRLAIKTKFKNKIQQAEVTRTEPFELKNITLSGESFERSLGKNSENELRGELTVTDEPGVFSIDFGEVQKKARIDMSAVRLEGFSIREMVPFATEVFVEGVRDGDSSEIEATNIDFIAIGDPLTREARKRPRVLVIGDTISINYFRALKNELVGIANVHHPNTNCRGSENHVELHRWLGGYDFPDRKWDLIAFNFGHADSETDRDVYHANLELVIRRLLKTKAKLIWVQSTPIPYGFNDPILLPDSVIPLDKREEFEFEEAGSSSLLPGRMRDLNSIAKKVLLKYPEIVICDLWNVVKQNPNGIYDDWWFGRSAKFKFQQSKPLAAELAKEVRKHLK